MVCTGHSNSATCVGHTVGSCAAHNATICESHSEDTVCYSHVETICSAHINECLAHDGYIAPVEPTIFTDNILSTLIDIKAIHFNELKIAISNELIRRSASWPVNPSSVEMGDIITTEKIRQLRNGLNSAKSWSYPTYLNDDNTSTTETIEEQQYTAIRNQINLIEAECVCNCNYSCTCQCNYACTCVCAYACTCQCNYACTCVCAYACTCQCNYACTCVCNYCTCNCNYCTCACNYCTCQCAYSCTCVCAYACTCNCNYACTCNCNYACTCVCNYCTCNCNYCPCNCNYCPCNCNYTCVCNCNYSDERLKTDIIYM